MVSHWMIQPNFLLPGITSNLTSRIKYTAVDGVPSSVCYSIPSENLVVYDKFFRGSISLTLSNAPSSNSTTLWQPRPKPLAHFDVRIREGDIAVETNINEHPRLKFTKLRSQYKSNNSVFLDTCIFDCSSVVRIFSFDDICNYFTNEQRKVSFINNDHTIFASTVHSNVINTSRSNLATILTSSKLPLSQEKIPPIIILLSSHIIFPLPYFLTQ